MSDTCFLCHGPDASQREADLRLDTPERAYADRDGSPAIIPGDAEESLLTWMINAADAEDIMPPPEYHRALTQEEKDIFYRWINEGAKYDQHWAFVAPTKPEVPMFAKDHSENEIDAFIRKRLESEGLTLSAEADRRRHPPLWQTGDYLRRFLVLIYQLQSTSISQGFAL
jgi:hypothetical protein